MVDVVGVNSEPGCPSCARRPCRVGPRRPVSSKIRRAASGRCARDQRRLRSKWLLLAIVGSI